METSVRESVFDEVLDSQETFRALLDSMSRPGRIYVLDWKVYRGTPERLNPFVLSVMKTLLDHRVSFSLGGESETSIVVRYLSMNTAAPYRGPDRADYVLFQGSVYSEDFSRLKRGSLEFPEGSATALLSVQCIEEEDGRSALSGIALTLAGPGVKGQAHAYVVGLDRRYLDALAFTNVFFPLGVDVILVDETGRLLGIPRTCKVEAR